MRRISKIIWHCTATPPTLDVDRAILRRWHVTERGWSDIGYHYLIRLDGEVVACRPVERAGAHCRGQNANSIGIAYAGGVGVDRKPLDTRTEAQKSALYELTDQLIARFDLPEDAVHGHNEFAAKACPSFDAQRDWEAARAGRVEDGKMPEVGPIGAAVEQHHQDIADIKAWIASFKGA